MEGGSSQIGLDFDILIFAGFRTWCVPRAKQLPQSGQRFLQRAFIAEIPPPRLFTRQKRLQDPRIVPVYHRALAVDDPCQLVDAV